MSTSAAAPRVPAELSCGKDGAAVERRRLWVRGVVQGVGFRPFVWNLANSLRLSGSVRNTSGAVVIEVEGGAAALDTFAVRLWHEAPRLAHLEGVEVGALAAVGSRRFRIEPSVAVAGEHQPVAPDAATCADCLRELRAPADRRFGYPFLNCTNCGPRFTIIEAVPYDRSATTMRSFRMCAACQAEYADPADRRFHAQPNACPQCGPRLWFAGSDGTEQPGPPLVAALALLRAGRVVAVKGLGGFQLSCDAGNQAAVARLRARKHRPSKPFAVMVRDLAAARELCTVGAAEAALLCAPAAPIVLLRRHGGGGLAAAVAPGSHELGLMLPATPLHHLLLEAAGGPLVMTSGNLTEEPIAWGNLEAVARLGAVADGLLLHDREIAARYDDSVIRAAAGGTRLVRRARGYCPLPIDVAAPPAEVLALGAHLKNTFTLLRDGRAFVGPHIGDLDHPLSLRHQEESLATYLRLFGAQPAVVACDLHPDYASTRLAEGWWERGARRVQVQHHHAHIASVMAEHGLRGPLLGVAFDGAGLGPDGTVWGGEFLLCDERSYRRVGHIAEVALPGGDRCAREGWRMALAHLQAAGEVGDEVPRWAADGVEARSWRLVARVAVSAMTPRTSSAGRLFDAVASLLGAGHRSGFEAEAAMRLESLAAGYGGRLAEVAQLPVIIRGDPLVLDTPALVAALAAGLGRGRSRAELAAAFHETLAQAIAEMSARLAASHAVRRVALSGGVFQNLLLLERSLELLCARGLEVYTNHGVPANDGGVSLGQALVAAASAAAAEEGEG